ncbi:MFS transporter [Streptomyces sp. NBC_01446]|uniref:MFS transporter n=1 Tax=Streptomyces sp. NBC_01446 TaxID=2903870 RepID=UPI002256D75D|nr:MFS transporter [Streptomyces sp. NBC_01446]MCX4642707.1 MFS transporter [Streptomyces sp. NBC_01446]
MAISSEQAPPEEREVARDEAAADKNIAADHHNDAAAPDPKRWMALLVLLVAAFMDMLDGTIANVASPAIQHGIGGGYSVIQWVLVGYQLSFALLLILGGRLGDIYGRKRMFLLGVVGFTLASLGAGAAQEPWQLVASRMVQGAFAGIMVPQILAIIHVTFSAKERAGAFAMYGGVAGLAAAIGMGAGGPLAEWDLFGLDWRLIFLINIPVGILGMIYAPRVLRESKAPHALKLDVRGVFLATAGLLLLIFPLLQGRELGWPLWGFVSMVASVPVLAAFVLWQKRKTALDRSPLMELALFRIRSFTSGLGVNLAFYIGIGMFNIGWTVYMQVGLGWSPMRAGLTSISFCVGAFLTSSAAMIALVPKFGRKVLQAGAVVTVAGTLSFLWAAGHYGSEISSWHLVVPMLLVGLGFGLIAAPLPQIVISEVPQKDAGSASGIVHTNAQLGFAIGGALVSVVFFAGLAGNTGSAIDDQAAHLRKDLVATAQLTPGQADATVAAYKSCAVARVDEKDPAVVPKSCTAPELRNQQAAPVLAKYAKESTGNSFALSLQTTLWVFAGVVALAFLLMLAIPRQMRLEAPEDEGAESAAGTDGTAPEAAPAV